MSSSSTGAGSGGGGVQVVVRLRPLNDQEKKHGTLPVVSASTGDKTVTVVKGNGPKRQRSSYRFDDVFTAFSTQSEVFEATLQPTVRDVMNGYECTAFAYGQTGTGKTHTMEGNLRAPDEYGIIPRSAEAIFQELSKPEYQSRSVTCSYLEIYNEELCDLLVDANLQPKQKQQSGSTKHSSKSKPPPTTTKLQIVEGKNGPYCNGLSCKSVSSAEDVLDLIRQADNQRKVGETKMNKQSSRSHCIFTIQVDATRQCGDGSILEIQGKLHLVDLAGSECAKNANMDGTPGNHQAARERERMNINRSLLTLGRVVSMLKEQSSTTNKKSGASSSVRIPYRDSKLTRILQESLGGRCKTCIIATLSPSVLAVEESISTLNYAQAANGIINKPISTSYMSQTPSSSSQTMSGSIPGGLSGGGEGGATGTVEHWQEMELRLEYMQVQVDEAQGALARKHLEHQQLVEQAEMAEAARLQMEEKYNVAIVENNALKERIAKEVATRRETELNLRQTMEILCATQKTEVSLTAEANALIDALQKSIADGNEMHRMILENRQADVDRRLATKKFNYSARALLEGVLTSLDQLSEKENEYRVQLVQIAEDGEKQHLDFAREVLQTIHNTSNIVAATANALQSYVNGGGDGENGGTGILASSKATASNISQGMADVKRTIAEGEDNLQKDFDKCKEQLSEYGTKLNKLESIHGESCQKTLLELDHNVSASKDKVTSLISSATKALDEAKQERMKVHDAVTSVLRQWKASTADSAGIIDNHSSTQQTAVNEMLDTMNTEMKRYDDIESFLTNQKSMLQNAGACHAQELKKQGELLVSHKDALFTSQQQQKEVCEQFVNNIMTGVQDLVQKQMAATIMKAQNDHFATLIANNSGLIEWNTGSRERYNNEIVPAVDSTNDSLRGEVQAIRRTDQAVAGLLQNTRTVLGTIKNTSIDQIASVEKFADNAVKGMQEVNKLEVSSSTKIEEKMGSDGEQCANHLQEVLYQSTKEGISTVEDVGCDVISFTRDGVIAPMSSTINAMEESRPGMMTAFNGKCDSILTDVERGVSEIEQASLGVSKASDEMGNAVISTEKNFVNNVAEVRKASVSKHREDLAESAAKHCDATTTAISDSMAKSTGAKEAVGDFATNVIRIGEEVDPAPDRNVIDYSTSLTATPLDHVILKNLDENIDEPTEDPELSTTTNDENVEVNMSTESKGRDVSNSGGNTGQTILQVSSPNRRATMSPRHRRSNLMKPGASSKHPPGSSQPQTKRAVQRGGTPVVKKRTKR